MAYYPGGTKVVPPCRTTRWYPGCTPMAYYHREVPRMYPPSRTTGCTRGGTPSVVLSEPGCTPPLAYCPVPRVHPPLAYCPCTRVLPHPVLCVYPGTPPSRSTDCVPGATPVSVLTVYPVPPRQRSGVLTVARVPISVLPAVSMAPACRGLSDLRASPAHAGVVN